MPLLRMSWASAPSLGRGDVFRSCHPRAFSRRFSGRLARSLALSLRRNSRFA